MPGMFLPSPSAKTVGLRPESFGSTKAKGLGINPMKTAMAAKMPKQGGKMPAVKAITSKYLNSPKTPKFSNLLKGPKTKTSSATSQKAALKNVISKALAGSRNSGPVGLKAPGGLGAMPLGGGMGPMGGGAAGSGMMPPMGSSGGLGASPTGAPPMPSMSSPSMPPQSPF